MVPLFYGMDVVLEDRQCVAQGVVRGCHCIVRDIIFDGQELSHSDDPVDEPTILQYVPLGLVLEVPGAQWVKDPVLGPGKFFLPRKKSGRDVTT